MEVIRAELLSSRRAYAKGLAVTANAPILAMCRKLIEAGYNPASPLEAYRHGGSLLCLRVRSIGEGAQLEVDESSGNGTPRFRKSRDRSRLEGPRNVAPEPTG